MKKRLCFLFVVGQLSFLTSAQAQRLDHDVSTYSKYIQAVDEYKPAPGQFVNDMPEYEEGDDAAAMARKCTEYLANNARSLVSLGGYGGFITFHFDHSIANIAGERDFFIEGNAYQESSNSYAGGSSEPGIVMVSKDVNGNGLPDDAWYELAGSADVDSVGKVVYDYEITYRRNPMKEIPWEDNRGGSGVIDRMDKYNHTQEYYPEWLEDNLSFRGTLLPGNAIDSNGKGTYWVLMFLRDGYVDNKPASNREANSFDISWAVDEHRKPVSLDFVDFIRVYTAVNQKCGWLGETSTEVMGAEDLHLDASVEKVRQAIAGITSLNRDIHQAISCFSMEGKQLNGTRPGLNIVRMSDGKINKLIVK